MAKEGLQRKWEDRCAGCGARRLGEVYKTALTGPRYYAILPVRCRQRAACERQVMKDYEIATDAEIAQSLT